MNPSLEMGENAMNELQAQLQVLRPVLLTEKARSFLDLFDEFMEQREFGLALHVVCDFFLDPNSPRVSGSIIDQIQRLHAVMRIDDRCVEELQSQKLP
jgi:hypothetical protein